MGRKKDRSDVLSFSHQDPVRGTVRAHYEKYRAENGLRPRCDNEECPFHTRELVWCGKPVPLILDHVDGCPNNNLPGNLRYLCPICNEQLVHTKGGANRGRIRDLGEYGYNVAERGSDTQQGKAYGRYTATDSAVCKKSEADGGEAAS